MSKSIAELRNIARQAAQAFPEPWEADTFPIVAGPDGKRLSPPGDNGTWGGVSCIVNDGVYGAGDGRIMEHIAAFDPAAVLELLDRLEAAEGREDARLRDLGYPDFAPESVTDAAFASQADWWVPGDGDGHATVLVPQLIETVAEAAYRATLAHLKEAS